MRKNQASRAAPFAGQPAVQAYRQDLGDGAALAVDETLLAVASLVHQARFADNKRNLARLYREAANLARPVISAEELRNGAGRGEPPARSQVDILRVLARVAARSGRPHLALSITQELLDQATAAPKRLALAADVTWLNMQLGRLDLASAQARRSQREARRLGDRLQLARASCAEMTCEMLRGNIQRADGLSRRALRFARAARSRHYIAECYLVSGTIALYAGRHDDAIRCYWSSYSFACTWEQRSGIGINLAQALIDAGYPVEARIISTSVLSGPLAARAVFPALAGYALSSADLGDRAGVEWAYSQVFRVPGGPNFAREYTIGLHASAESFQRLGDAARAAGIYALSNPLIEKYGFHDLKFRDDIVRLTTAMRTRRPLTPPAGRAVEEIRQLDPDLPEALEVV